MSVRLKGDSGVAMVEKPFGGLFAVIALAAVLTGCATVNFDYPKTESYGFSDTGQTSLGQQVGNIVAAEDERDSGFYLLRDGMDSLAMRLQLIKRAERSVDVQVYEFYVDVVGRVWIHHLLEAADRGVRVRLLLDDISTAGYDAGMAGLSSHPNIEIRVFNPFARGFAGRTRSIVTDLGRVNRRMHNKTFIVDNQVMVVGGRNIAAEYYNANMDARFSDLDVFGLGPVVDEASNMFDTYWNHVTALPVPAFADMPEDPTAELERVRKESAAAREAILDTPYAAAVREKELDFVDLETHALNWIPYTLIYDSPDKGVQSRKDEAESITTPLFKALESAQRELLIVTPYFVPRKSGIERFTELRNRGVQVTIVTNSLASQNQTMVHGGYAPSRKELLQQGVRLYEFRPDEVQDAQPVENDDRLVTLHTKAFVVDRQKLFVGSFNFDPRSSYINTEQGIIFESQALAEEFSAVIESALPDRTFEVFLNEEGKLRWRYHDGEREVVADKEPQTTWSQRTSASFARLLPIRGHL